MNYSISGNLIITESPLDFKAILTCGQTFRFREVNGGYEVFSVNRKCVCHDNVIEGDPEYFISYFDLDTDYKKYLAPLYEFEELRRGIELGSGIRILRQDLFEVIISFIISANNNIPRIKGIIERICAYCGEDKGGYFAFPTPQKLSEVSAGEFRELGAGFRDKYLAGSAKVLANTDFLEKIRFVNTDEAAKMLTSLPGVGPKVADCILLFGLRRFDCFPVDTWIMKQCSSKELDTPKKVREFYLNRYGSLAGLAQQYIFYGAREK